MIYSKVNVKEKSIPISNSIQWHQRAINISFFSKKIWLFFFSKMLLKMTLLNKRTIFNQPCLTFADDLYEKNLPRASKQTKSTKNFCLQKKTMAVINLCWV